MTFEKHQGVYVLKYMNKYYKMASYASSPNDYLTDDVLEATKFPFKLQTRLLPIVVFFVILDFMEKKSRILRKVKDSLRKIKTFHQMWI